MRKPTLFCRGVIHTLSDRRPKAEWFTILAGRVQHIGSGEPPPAGRTVDLAGRTVVPGFVDAHTHFFQTGLDRLFIDVSGAQSVEQLCQCLLDQAPKTPRSWVFAHSFEEDTLTDAPKLTRFDLDRHFPQRPVWINRIDYHSAVVNSAALQRLAVPAGTPGLLQDKGQPTGVLRSDAYFHAKARIARMYPLDVRDKAVRSAAEACIENGITAVHALEGGKIFGDEGVAAVLRRVGKLPLDVTMFLQEMNVPFGTRFGFRHLGGCILIDGSIGSYTAALDEPYRDLPGQRGMLYEKTRELNAFIEEAHVEGVQLAFHAIGPRAIEQVLSGYERAARRFPRYDHRHRIEHFELATDDQIRRAADLGLIVSMQPAFEHYWGGPAGMYAARIGERWKGTNRLRSILDRGLRIAGGSDTNVTPPIPLLGMHAAVNHPNPAQRAEPSEALRMMTLDAAYAAFTEDRMGSLCPGKEANFIVLDRDPLAVDRARIKDVRVLETWYRGRQVFRRC